MGGGGKVEKGLYAWARVPGRSRGGPLHPLPQWPRNQGRARGWRRVQAGKGAGGGQWRGPLSSCGLATAACCHRAHRLPHKLEPPDAAAPLLHPCCWHPCTSRMPCSSPAASRLSYLFPPCLLFLTAVALRCSIGGAAPGLLPRVPACSLSVLVCSALPFAWVVIWVFARPASLPIVHTLLFAAPRLPL